MLILVDENIPRMTVERLRELGHDVKDIRGTGDEGMADAGLWELALRERRLPITTDKGFTQYRAARHSGILIVRLRQPNRAKIHQTVMHGIEQCGDTGWSGLLMVIRDTTMSTARAGFRTER